MKVLMVLTSNSRLGSSGRDTGYWLEEFTAPYYAFRAADLEVSLASPQGGEPPIDPASLAVIPQPASDSRFLADSEARGAMATTLPLERVSSKDYDAVYYPGGHGVLWDLVEDDYSIRLLEEFLAAGKPTALVCHAPAVLSHALTLEGTPVVAGRRVSGTSNSEERTSGLQDVVPFKLEDRVVALGGHYSSAPDGQAHVVVDGNLITGQNPASALGVALALVKHLGAAVPAVGQRSKSAASASGLVSAAVIPLLSAMTPVIHVPPFGPQIQREVIQRTPISGSALELVAYRITVPPGASAPPHCHPAVGMGYVIEGEFESQFRGGPITHKRAGDSFVDEAVTEHVLFRNPSKTAPLLFVVVYVWPPGTPQQQPGQSCPAPAATTKDAIQ